MVVSHAPAGYVCPFCLLAQGAGDARIYSLQTDVVYHDTKLTAFIGSHQWPNNAGNTIIIPNRHYENLYTLPLSYATGIQHLARRLALAMKTVWACEGISTRQHNEPAGSQDVWHYHLHITPRYQNDDFYCSQRALMAVAQRAELAARLREGLAAVLT